MKQGTGLTWLNGKKWAEVTRDERFFCAHLYKTVLAHMEGIPFFIDIINDTCGLTLDKDAHWELGYEVCFYRDLWFHNSEKYKLLSPKRTFDLCLFSDEIIVIIEAKAYQEFDRVQVADFVKDKKKITDELCVPVKKVFVIALAASGYQKKFAISELADSFDGNLITWNDLSAKYDNDQILNDADKVYDLRPKRPGSKVGEQLMKIYIDSDFDIKDFWVGRSGGMVGLEKDISEDVWRSRRYEIALLPFPPNSKNWFSLDNFAKMVGVSQK